MTAAEPHATFRRWLWACLALGALGFGGGWVVVANVRRTFVERLKWLTEQEFVELTGVAAVMPGTTAASLLALIGYRRGGVAWACAGPLVFVTPGVASVLLLAVEYDRLRALGWVMALFAGMGAAVVGVVLAVAIGMRQQVQKGPLSALLALAAFALLVSRAASLPAVIAGAGLVGVLAARSADRSDGAALVVAVMPKGASALSVLWVFSKIGIATFGGGYAMIPAMETEVVARGWVDSATFTDAITLGQMTPGPVALSGTFIGFRAGGLVGALAATLGMFGPPLVVSVLAARYLTTFRTSALVRGFMSGVSPAVVGVIAAAAVSVARVAIVDVSSGALALAACVLLVARPRVSPVLVLFVGATLRWCVAHWVG